MTQLCIVQPHECCTESRHGSGTSDKREDYVGRVCAPSRAHRKGAAAQGGGAERGWTQQRRARRRLCRAGRLGAVGQVQRRCKLHTIPGAWLCAASRPSVRGQAACWLQAFLLQMTSIEALTARLCIATNALPLPGVVCANGAVPGSVGELGPDDNLDMLLSGLPGGEPPRMHLAAEYCSNGVEVVVGSDRAYCIP